MKQDAPFRRAAFTDGMLLTAEDLRAQQKYDGGKRRLLSRAFFGWGVAYGLEASLAGEAVCLSPGLALDCRGREIYVPGSVCVCLDRLFPGGGRREGAWRLCLEYAERAAETTELYTPDADPAESVPCRVEEGFRLSARETAGPEDFCLGILRLVREADAWEASFEPGRAEFHDARPAPAARAGTAAGSVLFDLRRLPGPDGVYYSREISHGLGPGEVFVTLAVRGWQEGHACLLTGDIGLFGAQIRCAVKAFPERGTFIAALRCDEAVSRHVRLEWRAERAGPVREEPHPPAPPGRLRLEPACVRLRPGESARFTLTADGRPWNGPCDCRVCDGDGGVITDSGWYTAPRREGVYRVEAVRREYPGTPVSAYAIVRDGDESG